MYFFLSLAFELGNCMLGGLLAENACEEFKLRSEIYVFNGSVSMVNMTQETGR